MGGKEPKTDGDCISRENTLKAMIEQLGIRNEDYLLPAEATSYKVVKNMPPVQQEPKTGHWITGRWSDDAIRYNDMEYKCSFCHHRSDFTSHFCPNCGAKMEVSE